MRSFKNCILGRLVLGFTLAEVLVTLGIIGVVAAVTMPTLMTKHRNKVYEGQFKVAHSLIAQAVDQLAQDKFDVNTYYCGANRIDAKQNTFLPDFAQYFQIIKSDYTYQTSDLTRLGYKKSYFYQSAPGARYFNYDSHNNGAIILKNGMMIASSGCWWMSRYVDFIVDTNGTKGPNKFGYDLFYFQIGDDNKLYPSAGKYYLSNNTDALMQRCCNFREANTCSVPQDTGVSCALYALENISPHDSTKGYWESLP